MFLLDSGAGKTGQKLALQSVIFSPDGKVVAEVDVFREARPYWAAGSASIYDRALLVAGGWTKLLALVVASVFAIRSAVLLGKGNPARAPWSLLSSGLVGLSLGQATLVYFQTFLGHSPFPSVADVFFVAVLFWPFIFGVGWQVLLSDGDTGLHIRAGEIILQSGRLP